MPSSQPQPPPRDDFGTLRHRKQICEAAVSSPAFRGKYKVPVFKVEEGVPQSLGKIYEDAKSREALGGWKPRYSSFADFMSKQDSREDALV
jgi:hypothetical protein